MPSVLHIPEFHDCDLFCHLFQSTQYGRRVDDLESPTTIGPMDKILHDPICLNLVNYDAMVRVMQVFIITQEPKPSQQQDVQNDRNAGRPRGLQRFEDKDGNPLPKFVPKERVEVIVEPRL